MKEKKLGKIKLKKSERPGMYQVDGIELRNALKSVDLPKEYKWIMKKRYSVICLFKFSVKELNDIWKSSNKKRAI